jgi:hypothetical protein
MELFRNGTTCAMKKTVVRCPTWEEGCARVEKHGELSGTETTVVNGREKPSKSRFISKNSAWLTSEIFE